MVTGPFTKRVALFIALPFALFIFLATGDWDYRALFGLAEEPTAKNRFEHINHRRLARVALAEFRELPEDERQAIRTGLAAALRPVDAWLADVRKADHRFLCLGEAHDAETRRFLADKIIPGLRIDRLYLETTPNDLAKIIDDIDAGREVTPLLGADIGGVLRAVRQANPGISLVGIDETDRQGQARRGDPTLDREDSILANLRAGLRSGGNQAILYGALHCGDNEGWLYRMARAAMPSALDDFLNVRVMPEHREGAVEALFFFVDGIGLPVGDVAISRDADLPPRVREWFSFFVLGTLAPYRTLVVFRP